MSTPVNRRQLVKTAATATAALGPALHSPGKEPASGRVRIGLIGCGGRDRQLEQVLKQFPDVEIPVICDVFEPRMDQTAKVLSEGPRTRKPDRVVDHERIAACCPITQAMLCGSTPTKTGLPWKNISSKQPACTRPRHVLSKRPHVPPAASAHRFTHRAIFARLGHSF